MIRTTYSHFPLAGQGADITTFDTQSPVGHNCLSKGTRYCLLHSPMLPDVHSSCSDPLAKLVVPIQTKGNFEHLQTKEKISPSRTISDFILALAFASPLRAVHQPADLFVRIFLLRPFTHPSPQKF